MVKVVRMLVSFLFYSACITGFLHQVKWISRVYFEYKTSSVVQYMRTPELSVPTINLCIRYTDILDWDRLFRDKQTSNLIKRSARFQDMIHAQSLITIRNILDYTPSVTSILKDVHYRTRGSYLEYHTFSPADIFNVSKYYMHENVCYRLQAIHQQDMQFQRIASSLHASGIMFKLSFSQSLAPADIFSVVLHMKEMSTTSFYFSQTMNRLADFDSLQPLASAFYYTYAMNHISLLEAPHDTMCHKSKEKKHTCLHNCLMYHMMNRTGRAPFQTYITEGIDVKHVNHYDMQNQTIKQIVNQVDLLCSNLCFTISCHFHFICTSIDHVSLDVDHDFRIMIMVPKIPGIRIFTIVNLTFTSFLTYVCSCFCTWFGVSALAVNPFNFIIHRLIRKRSPEFDRRNRRGTQ